MSRDRLLALATMVALLSLSAVGSAWADGSLGGNNVDLTSTSEFGNMGDVYNSITVGHGASATDGRPGSYGFPVNLTIYGKQHVRFPADPRDFESYCFIVSYSTAHIDEVATRRTGAAGSYELSMDRDYLEPAELAHRAAVSVWQAARDAVDADNVQREADGLEPLPYPSDPRPTPPTFPLEPCPGEPAQLPDFTPAFLAAAEAIDQVPVARPRIQPGRGITGLTAYLETQRPTMTFDTGAQDFPRLGEDISATGIVGTGAPLSGTVQFSGYGEWTVDWGDGMIDGPHNDPGVAYGEEGNAITHAYRDVGSYGVQVSDRWWVTMDIGFLGETYTFNFEAAPVDWPVLSFPVDEVRSVRER